ncbi:MAG TPA: HAD family hydrolase [Jatrophihabitans sp.]|nr:HAD family hydrolase [Jatrophihabitans sp.]
MPSADQPRRGVLFDVDGTLVDTTFLHAVCWAEALRQHGHHVTTADVHHAIGMGSDRLLDHLLGEDRDTDADGALNAAHKTLYKQHWGRLVPTPGAAELLRACAERGLVVVLASSASDEELAALRSALGADDAITVATSADEAETSKPAADILEAALDRAGLDAGNALFVGDAVWDGAAAGNAQLRFIGVTCGGTPEVELRAAGAIEAWRDPAELVANLSRSAISDLVAR